MNRNDKPRFQTGFIHELDRKVLYNTPIFIDVKFKKTGASHKLSKNLNDDPWQTSPLNKYLTICKTILPAGVVSLLNRQIALDKNISASELQAYLSKIIEELKLDVNSITPNDYICDILRLILDADIKQILSFNTSDLSNRVNKQFQSIYPDAKILNVEDLSDIPPEKAFDIIHCSNWLHHMTEQQQDAFLTNLNELNSDFIICSEPTEDLALYHYILNSLFPADAKGTDISPIKKEKIIGQLGNFTPVAYVIENDHYSICFKKK